MTPRSIARSVFFSAALLWSVPVDAAPAAPCGQNVPDALMQARAASKAGHPAQDHTALMCLIEAVAALNAKIEGLSDGTLAFSGPIHAPKGVTITKSSLKEGD